MLAHSPNTHTLSAPTKCKAITYMSAAVLIDFLSSDTDNVRKEPYGALEVLRSGEEKFIRGEAQRDLGRGFNKKVEGTFPVSMAVA